MYQVDFNGRHALRLSVNPLMYPADVAACLQILARGFRQAAENSLLNPGDFDAETVNGDLVEVYLLEENEGSDPDESETEG